MPFTEARTNPLGVLHRAEILTPDESERRVVNSMMLEAGGPEEIGDDQLRAFVKTEEVSKKFYG